MRKSRFTAAQIIGMINRKMPGKKVALFNFRLSIFIVCLFGDYV